MRFLYILRYLGGLFWLTQLSFPANAQVPDVTAPRATLRLGSGQPFEVRAENADDKGPSLRAGDLRVPVPLRVATSTRNAIALSAEAVQLQGGASVGVVRLTAAGQQAAVLLVKRASSKLESLWVGRLDFTGDPGERHADVLEVADRDADGHPDIVVGQYDEHVGVCGQEHTLLSPRAVDPKTLTLRSVLLNRYSQRTVGLQLSAAEAAPGTLEPPALLHALTSGSASSSTEAHGLVALTDGDLRTYWEEGRGLGGRFEFATLQWSAPSRPLVALAFVPVPEGAAPDTQRAKLRSLALLGPNQERWTIALPDDVRPGQRYWVTPPQPLAWRCLTLAIDELAATPPPTAQTHASLAEVEAYTDLDQGGGLAKLVKELGEPGARGDDATALLLRAQGDVNGALVAAWPSLPSAGKRRALRLLFLNPSAADPRSEPVLRSALRDDDAEVVSAAIKLAMGKAPFGAGLLSELAHSASKQGDLAAQSIGHSKRADALAVLLTILVEPGASERPVLRDAIAAAYQNQSGSDALQTWTGSEGSAKPRAARAALALALSNVPSAQPLAAQLLHELSRDASEFSEQWRLVQAARALPSEPEGDGFLETLAQRADPWMLRSAAVEALAQRKAPDMQGAAQRALDDVYPRVRASAVAVLAKVPAAFDLLSKKVREDKWFLVRRAAMDELPDSAAARAWFIAELSDPIATVRASAIRALTRVGAFEAWPKIEPALQNPEEYPEVIAEGVAYVRALCVHAAVPSLQLVVTRGLKPEAWSQDQELALAALEVISSFGGKDAEWAHARASSSLVPKEVQLAAAAALKAKQAPACAQKSPSL